jgi:glutaredoxin
MKIKKKTLKLSLVGIGILVFIISSISYLTSHEDPAISELAQCLTDKDATMYGSFWCGHCSDQKKLFGNSFKNIDYVECDERGDNPQPERCQIEGITGYPTWKINGQIMSGVISLNQLSSVAGCEYGI